MNKWLRMGGVTINCRDPERLCTFYCDVLGFQRRTTTGQDGKVTACDASSGDVELVFRLLSGPTASISLTFYVDDLRREIACLRERGIEVQQPYVGQCDVGGLCDYMRIASFSDPDGNLINLQAVEPDYRPQPDILLRRWDLRFGMDRNVLSAMLELVPPFLFVDVAQIEHLAATPAEAIELIRFIGAGGNLHNLLIDCQGDRESILSRVRRRQA